GFVNSTFLAHTDSAVNVSIGTANVGGAGEVHMFLNSQTFGTINQASSLTMLDVHYQLADQDFAGVGAAPITTINGFSASHDDVIYNGVNADAPNFFDAGHSDSLTSLNPRLDTELDGTYNHALAVHARRASTQSTPASQISPHGPARSRRASSSAPPRFTVPQITRSSRRRSSVTELSPSSG